MEIFATFNFSIAAQVNRKIEGDIEFSERHDQVNQLHVYSRNKGYICVKMMARHRVFVNVSFFILFLCFFFSIVLKIDKKCANSTQTTIAQLLRLTIVSAKSKIYSPRRGYLSPGHHQGHNLLPILGLILLNSSTLPRDLYMFVSYARAAGLLSPRTYTLRARSNCPYSGIGIHGIEVRTCSRSRRFALRFSNNC